MSVVITLRGPREVIEEIAALDIKGVEKDEPQIDRSLSDAADAPIGPQEVQQVLELITVAITTTTAGIELFEKVKGLIKTKDTLPVEAVDVKTNETLAKIDAQSDPKVITQTVFK